MSESKFEAEHQLTRYLLGELAEPERLALEEEYFADPRIFDRMVAAENDLIEAYVSDKLSAAERAHFEQRYLASPQRREQVEFFQRLARALTLEPPAAAPPSPAVGAARESRWRQRAVPTPNRLAWLGLAVGLALALAVSTAWLAREIIRLRRQAEQERAAHGQHEQALMQQLAAERNRNEQQARELDALRQTPTDAGGLRPQIVSFAWTLSGLRAPGMPGETVRRLVVPSDTHLARLSFRLPTARYSKYQLELRGAAGQVIWQRNHLQPNSAKAGATIALYVPAAQFKPGIYSLILSGESAGALSEVAEFPIEIVR
jgi:anti-sigma factor RsiW